MIRWRSGFTVLMLMGFAVWGPTASAWDTKETASEASKWRSIYLCATSSSTNRMSLCGGNEHERLADRALGMVISGSNPYSIAAGSDLHVIDLNASYFRYDFFGPPDEDNPVMYERQPGTWAGPLEERTLPNPPHFSGVADFTYTIYDWINKNRLCPAISSGELAHCHNYSIWMGAGFNSSHFGSQASASYLQLHRTALSLAGDARDLREAINGEGDATRLAHEDAIREAERMALAYEAAAQHFLQDRWSTGHMWERWNSPDHASNPYRNDIGQAAVIGAITGIIHGSEAVLGQPLHLSSPRPTIGLLGRDGVSPARWARASGGELYTGVGDYRANDMFRGRVGAEYSLYASTDWPLNVTSQRTMMMRCLAGGFREVISAFGTDPNSGGYGIEGVQLSGAGSGGVPGSCFDSWATNRSIQIAWGPLAISDDFTGTIIPLFVRMMLPTQARIDSSEVDTNTLANLGELLASYYGANISLTVDRTALTRISSSISWQGTFHGDDTDLARGGLGPFGRALTGNGYSAPDYLEPANISSLPDSDPRGRDTNTIFGFFNRAHAGEYCQGAQRRLEELRLEIRIAETPEERDRYRGVCQVLAQRIFSETRPNYEGRMRSFQVASSISAGATNVSQARPLCYVQPRGAITTGPTDDTLPFYLHQGYVPFNTSSEQPNLSAWSDTFNSWGYAQQSVANWCDQTPVINTMEEPEHATADVVAVVREAEARIELYGLNFGAGRGRVLVGRSWDNAVVVEDVIRWYDDRITFALGDQFDDVSFLEDKAYIFIEKEPGDDGSERPGYRSVGRFVLLSEVPRPQITSMRISRGDEVFYAYRPPAEDVDVGPFGFGEEEDIDDDDEDRFRPISPGEVTIDIQFNMDIDRGAEGTSVQLGNQEVDGEFRNRRRWRGTVDIDDTTIYQSLRGVQDVVVNVKADDGEWIDGEPATPGAQPDRSNKVVVDVIPVIVERIQVRGGGRMLYDAEWTGGPDLDEAPSLLTTAFDDPERMLRVSTARAAPADGEGRLRFELSVPVDDAPVVTVGGVAVELTGRDERWQGTFDFEQAANGAVDGDLPIHISAIDQALKGLDADPQSVAQMFPVHLINGSNIWARYEANRGAENSSERGGTDTWHRIGEPPALSMVIVLDASGSMGEQGRIENARAGIQQTLSGLPADQRIELGAIVFYNCNNIETIPFTRDVEAIRNRLIAVVPSGGTPLAGAYLSARRLLASAANPGALEWRYVTFSDGAETCDGNAAGAAQELEQLLRDHRNVVRGEEPEEEPPVRRAPLPVVACTPASWRAYTVEIDDNGSGFDDIRLINHWFIERVLPDGRCFNRLESKTYNVYYGSSRNRRGGGARSGWGINSRASDEAVEFGTSRNGAADLDRVRGIAQTARGQSVSLQDARGQIATAVAAALLEQEGS